MSFNKHLAVVMAVVCMLAAHAGAATIVGPTPYLSILDTPGGLFDGADHLICFQDFEAPDGPWETGFTIDMGRRIGPKFLSGDAIPVTDSVDADDGAIDADGTMGSSWFAGGQSLTITFDEPAWAAGFVFTDTDKAATEVSIEAFDAGGVLLTSLVIGGADKFWDDVFTGTTQEDRFFGVSAPEGVKSIRVTIDKGNGIEIDHVQFTKQIPEPSSLGLAFVGLAGAVRLVRRRRRSMA